MKSAKPKPLKFKGGKNNKSKVGIKQKIFSQRAVDICNLNKKLPEKIETLEIQNNKFPTVQTELEYTQHKYYNLLNTTMVYNT